MKNFKKMLICVLALLVFAGCSKPKEKASENSTQKEETKEETKEEAKKDEEKTEEEKKMDEYAKNAVKVQKEGSTFEKNEKEWPFNQTETSVLTFGYDFNNSDDVIEGKYLVTVDIELPNDTLMYNSTDLLKKSKHELGRDDIDDSKGKDDAVTVKDVASVIKPDEYIYSPATGGLPSDMFFTGDNKLNAKVDCGIFIRRTKDKNAYDTYLADCAEEMKKEKQWVLAHVVENGEHRASIYYKAYNEVNPKVRTDTRFYFAYEIDDIATLHLEFEYQLLPTGLYHDRGKTRHLTEQDMIEIGKQVIKTIKSTSTTKVDYK